MNVRAGITFVLALFLTFVQSSTLVSSLRRRSLNNAALHLDTKAWTFSTHSVDPLWKTLGVSALSKDPHQEWNHQPSGL